MSERERLSWEVAALVVAEPRLHEAVPPEHLDPGAQWVVAWAAKIADAGGTPSVDALETSGSVAYARRLRDCTANQDEFDAHLARLRELASSGSNGAAPAVGEAAAVGAPRGDGATLASRIKPRKVRWLMGRRIPLGAVTVLAGRGGAGKSTWTQAVAARVTRGQLGTLPGGSDLDGPRGVVIVTCEEDTAAVVMPRLAAMGADLDRVVVYPDPDPEDDEAPPWTFPAAADRLERRAVEVNAALVLVDVGAGLMDPGLKSSTSEDVRAFYRPLNRLAVRADLAVVCAHWGRPALTDRLTRPPTPARGGAVPRTRPG